MEPVPQVLLVKHRQVLTSTVPPDFSTPSVGPSSSSCQIQTEWRHLHIHDAHLHPLHERYLVLRLLPVEHGAVTGPI